MPVPTGHCRISLVGTQGSSEIFDTSFWTLGGSGSLGQLQDLVNAIADILKTSGAMTETLAIAPSSASYTAVRGYAYQATGTKATFVAEASLGLDGTGSVTHPLTTCCVVSLRTPNVGRSNRGRMYLPAGGAFMSTSSFFNGTGFPNLASEWAAIFGLVNAIELDGGGNPVVSVVSFTGGTSNVVTHVTVDSRPDTQRRRSNRQGTGTVYSADVIAT